jgi:uncharacterized protein
MRALLDVNVLIALLDADHVSHNAAATWFIAHAPQGWASCPSTQNGCIRVMSSRAYPNSLPIHAVTTRLAEACATPLHEFWSDDVSWLDRQRFDASRAHGPGQLTDLYLLGLAVSRGGRLVTFDHGISLNAITGASAENLVRL